MATLSEIGEFAVSSEDVSYALRNFLDEFYRHPAPELFAKAPKLLAPTLQDAGFTDAYLGGVAEHLARTYNLPIPDWVFEETRILKEPYFAARSFKLQRLLLADSPSAFRWRNIFVSADALSRV